MSLPFDVVIYHDNCLDGFGAAFSAWLALGDKVEYIAAKHDAAIPRGMAGKNILMVDFCYPTMEKMNRLTSIAKTVTILDHHKTAVEILEHVNGNIIKQLDMDHSGAALTFKYFFPDEEVPDLIKMIEDNDLWRFNLKDTKAFIVALATQPKTFEVFNALLHKENVTSLTTEGYVMLKQQQRMVEETAKKAADRNLHGYKAKIANSPNFQSQIGNALVGDGSADIGVVWYFDHHAMLNRVSLRSATPDVDVSKIAQTFGGGGHACAAGFQYTGNIEDIFSK